MVEEDGADIVKVTIECKEAAAALVRPHLDLVVIAAGHEEGLGIVEVDSADGAIVFLKAVYEGAHAVVPELYGGRV